MSIVVGMVFPRLEMSVDVVHILRDAHNAVKEADLPSEFQAVAFGKAVDLLSAPAGASDAAQAPSAGGPGATAKVNQNDAIGMIAQQLAVDRESVERVFHVEAEDLKLVLPSSKLSSAKKTATQEIALLVAAGRQASGLDQETTNAEKVREAAEHYRKYDSPNFSRTIKEMHDVFIVRESGRKKMVKMTQPGWEAARELVDRIVGGE